MLDRFPTMEEVEKADREQIARWYRFPPKHDARSHQNVLDRIADRFMNMGGLTPGLIKKLELRAVPNARAHSYS